ncbi:MAG TPA: nitroreductase family protein [Acidobacteriaceae bacterium]
MALSIEELNKLKAAPVEGLLPTIAHRWSPRAFTEAPVSTNDLKLILEAAHWAASSSNAQPWRYFVGVKGSETHGKIFDLLADSNKIWAGKPHVLILGVAAAKGGKGNPNPYALYDLGQSAVSLIFQATALGLATHSMGGFDREAAKRVFNLGEEYLLGAVIAIGHQAEPATLPEESLREREAAPRQRKPLSEIALEALDKPLSL